MKKKAMAKRLNVLLVLSIFLHLQLIAANTFTFRNGASDLNDENSYLEGVRPGLNDQVILPANCTVTLDSSDSVSWAIAEGLDRIIPEDATSRLVVNVDSGEAHLTVPFSASNVSDGDCDKGVLEKTGAGNLVIGGAQGRFCATGSTERYDYYVSIVVSAGTLTLPQNVTTGGAQHYGKLSIAKAATLMNLSVSPDVNNIWPSAQFAELSGSGTLTSKGPRPVQVGGTSVFSGKLSGDINLYVNGRMTLSGSDSDTTGIVTIRLNKGNLLNSVAAGGILYVSELGMAGAPSVLGAADTIETGDYGGGIVYTGDSGTTDKNFRFTDSSDAHSPSFISGGTNGGLVWSGKWGQKNYSDVSTKSRRLIIMGSHEKECVMTGIIEDAIDDDILFPLTIIKRGSGIWRMAHNDNRTGGGLYSIEEGTLRYDSVAERGQPSALGASDNLIYPDYRGGRDLESHRPPYAFQLGSEANTTATMEFTGSKRSVCSTRPVAVKGMGRFKISGSGAYSFRGFSSIASGSQLVLDTDRTDGHVYVGDISDGSAPLDVLKEGAGEIKVVGGMSFTGALKVKAGTLTLCATNRPYGWLRWVVKEKGTFCSRYKGVSAPETESPSNVELQMEEFAFFDKDGKRLDRGSSYHSGSEDLHLMPYKSVAEENASFYDLYGGNLIDRSKIATLFDGGAGAVSGVWGGVYIRSRVWPFCSMSNPGYWLRLVVRLPENSNPAASYDLAFFYGAGNSKITRAATAVAIDGSVDGVNWEPVADNDALEIPETGARWYADPRDDLVSVSGSNYTLKDHVGFPMRGTSTNGVAALTMPVSVSSGAVLKSAGKASISSLVLAKDGNGTIDGFVFAEKGSIDIEGDGMKNGKYSLPVDFKDCESLKNIEKWDLTINGDSAGAREIRVSGGGKVELVPLGLVIVVK